MSLLPAVLLAVLTLLTLGAVLTGCTGSTVAPSTDNSSLPSSASAAGVARSLRPSFSVSTGKGFLFWLDDNSGEVVAFFYSFPSPPICGPEAPALDNSNCFETGGIGSRH